MFDAQSLPEPTKQQRINLSPRLSALHHSRGGFDSRGRFDLLGQQGDAALQKRSVSCIIRAPYQ